MMACKQFIWQVIMEIRLLFDDSAGIETDENQNVTALHIACSLKMVKPLIEYRVNSEAMKNVVFRSLHVASQKTSMIL